MYTSIDLVERLKAAYGLASDYAAAKKLSISQTSITNWRNEKTVMDEEIALEMAELLELDPLEVVASIHIERATKTGKKSVIDFWTKYVH